MRSRFICIDYFKPCNESVEFMRLTPSKNLVISPQPLSLSSFINNISPLNITLNLQHFTIHNATLNKFYSDVLPNHIYIPQSPHTLEKSELSIDAKKDDFIEVLEFELPQLDISLENGCLFEKKLDLFSELLEADSNLGTIERELTFSFPPEVLDSVYLIEDITTDGCMEHEPFLLEDSSPVRDQVNLEDRTFPLFEVDESSLGIVNGVCNEGVCNEGEVLLFDKIETLVCKHGGFEDNSSELLGFLKIDILEYISGPTSSMHSSTNVMEWSNSYSEIDMISIIELSFLEGNQAYQKETADDNSSSLGILKFEECQFPDVGSYQFEDVFYNLAVPKAETCKKTFLKDLVVADFNELIASHELTLIDESFKSLPIPILSDSGKIKSHHELIEELLASLEPYPHSTSDDIYLDWQFLEKDYGNSEKYSSCWKQVLGIDKYSIDPITSIDERVIINYAFESDKRNVVNVEDSKESLNVHSVGISTADMCPNVLPTSSRLNQVECHKRGYQEISTDLNTEGVSSLTRSFSPFDNLNFFLNHREATANQSSKPSGEVTKSKSQRTKDPSLDQIAPCTIPTMQPQTRDIKFHQVSLSGYVLELIDVFQKNYLNILKGDPMLAKIQQSSSAMDDTALLSLPKSTLMDWIKKANGRIKSMADGNDTRMALVSLCAIKQMSWYLCYFGIHVTYIYLKQLCGTLDFLKYKLSSLKTLIEDVHAKATREVAISHPSLSIIESVLLSQMNYRGTGMKILIVADQVSWMSLKRLLTSLHLSYCDQQSLGSHKNQANLGSNIELTEAVQHSDCFLISNEYISASFRFDIFSIILEYGGSCSLSRVSTINPQPLGTPGLHFFKVELVESSAAKALCQGVGMPCSTPSSTELEQLLNFIPCEEKCHTGSSSQEDVVFTNKTEQISKNLPNIPSAEEPGPNPSNTSSFPETLVIVNTQNMSKEMIISRRSTYQKILAIEKRGAQVVERDLNFPVDVIISAAMCLVWYDCGNIGKKASASGEASSSLPLCIDNIAANILTSLSFSFSCCVLVFEGESNFLSAVMESSDELYAAAFSLRMDLQLFLSHSSELTDEIILNCIDSTTKLTRQIYPKMPESETLAESFLTSFPSLNPLSAHAVLSSGGTLAEFLEASHERRLRAIQKFHVPNESFRLFGALCKFGEREDTRSAMTDCSSSVSSATESRNYHCKPESLKKVQYGHSPPKIDIPTDDLFNFEMLEQFGAGDNRHTQVSKSHEARSYHSQPQSAEKARNNHMHITESMDDLFNFEMSMQFGHDKRNQHKVTESRDGWTLVGDENFDEIKGPGLFSSDFSFREKQGTRAAGVTPLKTLSRGSTHINFQMPRTSTSYEMKKGSWPFDEELFGLEEAGRSSPLDKINFNTNQNSRMQQDLRGEVIDITDNFPSIDDFSSIPKSADHSGYMLETDRYTSMGNSRTARRLSFGGGHLPTFPTSNEVSSNFSVWENIDELGQSSSKHTNPNFSRNRSPLKPQGDLFEKCPDRRQATYFPSQSVQERYTQQPRGTTLANAVLSDQPQKGSPWTIEFLNKIKEKSRLRHQALPPNMSPICSPFLKNTSKGTKRKSPSILDFYRYQGGSTKTPKKINDPKRQKRPSQPPASAKKEKTVPNNLPAWTPLDKRARRTLHFSTGGTAGQSKLIWSDNDAQNMKRRFYH